MLRSIGRSSNPAKTTGTVQVIVVLVRFSDHADRPMPSREDIDFLFNGQGTGDDRAPTGTMRDFFRYQSINQFTVQAHVQDWVTVGVTEEEHSFGNYGLSSAFATVAYDTLEKMDRDGVDWGRYDEDGDGILDTVFIMHSGYVAEGGGTDCNNNKESGVHRIWSHATSVTENQDSWFSSDRSVTIGRYATTSAVFGTCGSDIQRIAVIGHELVSIVLFSLLLLCTTSRGH
jgi:M6 family metalloprotease-like protein